LPGASERIDDKTTRPRASAADSLVTALSWSSSELPPAIPAFVSAVAPRLIGSLARSNSMTFSTTAAPESVKEAVPSPGSVCWIASLKAARALPTAATPGSLSAVFDPERVDSLARSPEAAASGVLGSSV